MDGTRWNGKGFICPRNVDGQPQECECEYCTLDVDSDWEDEDKKAPRIVVLSSLLDIAKPAKPKGKPYLQTVAQNDSDRGTQRRREGI